MWVWLFSFWKNSNFLSFKNQSKLPRWGDQSYHKVAAKLSIYIKDMNIKILCFFIHAFPTCLLSQKKCQRNDSLFIYDNYISFSHASGKFDRLIKATPGAIKVTPTCDQSYPIWRGNIDPSLIQNIFKKTDHHLWKRYRT